MQRRRLAVLTSQDPLYIVESARDGLFQHEFLVGAVRFGRITTVFYEFDDQITASTVVHLAISVGWHDLDRAARHNSGFAARASRAGPDASPLLISDGYDSTC